MSDRAEQAKALIEERLAAATPGPWSYSTIESVGGGTIYDQTVAIAHVEWDNVDDNIDPRIRRHRTEEQADAVGVLIANAPADIAYLLAALTVSEGEVARLQQGIDEALKYIALHGAFGAPMFEIRQKLKALSQPTTDTNGAHA